MSDGPGTGVLCDDTGAVVPVPSRVSRVVSLVPSLTESVAATAPGLLVGATDWCTHPADLDVPRVRGTKNPDLQKIIDLRPDVVLANIEENRAVDLEALREAGVPVWVTVVRTVDEAVSSLRRMLTDACRLSVPNWLDAAEQAWRTVGDGGGDALSGGDAGGGGDALSGGDAGGAGGVGAAVRRRPGRRVAVVPIWRRPWMVVGRETFAGDVLSRLGVDNAYAHHPDRYPKIPLEEILAFGPDLVVLPDEPYRFTAEDGPECFPGIDVALVNGRDLTWYGPSLVDAPARLSQALRGAGPGRNG